MTTAKLLIITAIVALLAIGLALLYVGSGPGELRLATILTTIFGVGLTVMMAGALMALMYHSDRSGRDQAVGRKRQHQGKDEEAE